MIDKEILEKCRLDSYENDKWKIIDAINAYLNMFPQLIPVIDISAHGMRMASYCKKNNYLLLDWDYFSSMTRNDSWDVHYDIIYDKTAQAKRLVIDKRDGITMLSNRLAVNTLHNLYNKIVYDIFHQILFLKCKKNINYFLQKLNAQCVFFKHGELIIRTKSFQYCDRTHTLRHNEQWIKFDNYRAKWYIENKNNAMMGFKNCVKFIVNYIKKVSKYQILTLAEVTDIMNKKVNDHIAQCQQNHTEILATINS